MRKILVFDPAGYTMEYSYFLAKELSLSYPNTYLAVPEDTHFSIPNEFMSKTIFTYNSISASQGMISKILEGMKLVYSHFKIIHFIRRNSIEVVIHQINPISLLGLIFNFLIGRKVQKAQILHNINPSHGNRNILISSCYKLYLKSLDSFITHSKSSKKEFIERFGFKEKLIFSTPLPLYQIRNMDDEKETDFRERKLSNKRINFLIAGSIKKYKGIEVAVGAAKILMKQNITSFQIVIAGKSHYDLTEIKNVIKLNKLDSIIKIIDNFLPDALLNSLLEDADCMLLPYLDSDGSGILSLAIHYEIPVIASDLKFFEEMINDHYAGEVFITSSQSELSEKMKQFILDSSYRNSLSKKCHRKKNVYQNWGSYSKEVIGFISKSTR